MVLTVLIIWLLWLVLVFTLQHRIMFPRGLANGRALPAAPAGFESLWMTTERGDAVEAWFVPAQGVDGRAPLLVMLHGNAELIDDWHGFAARQSQRGWAVLMPEYRGYGRSGGSPSQQAIGRDMVALLTATLERADVDAGRVAFLGRSIGAGVAADLALQRPPDAMALVTPPARMGSFAWRLGAPPFLLRSPFRTDRALALLDIPVLILASAQDEIIPAAHGRLLRDAALDATFMEFDGGHNNLRTPAEEARRDAAIDAFFDEHVRNAGNP